MVRNRSTVKLQPSLFLETFVVSQLVGSIVERVVDGSDVSASEYAVTSAVGAMGSATPTQLARVLGLPPTTLTAILDRLVRKRELRRVRHPRDGRSYVIELTKKGEATNARNGARVAGELSALREELDDPVAVLDTLRTLEAALRATLFPKSPERQVPD
jgi:DNA-binding MarR family transcriptional regulator